MKVFNHLLTASPDNLDKLWAQKSAHSHTCRLPPTDKQIHVLMVELRSLTPHTVQLVPSHKTPMTRKLWAKLKSFAQKRTTHWTSIKDVKRSSSLSGSPLSCFGTPVFDKQTLSRTVTCRYFPTRPWLTFLILKLRSFEFLIWSHDNATTRLRC